MPHDSEVNGGALATGEVRELGSVLGWLGGDGGVIAVGRDGRIAMPFNSEGMLRAAMDSRGSFITGLLRD